MEDLEGKFRSLEIDAEIQKLKQNLQNPHSQNGSTYTTSKNQREHNSTKETNFDSPTHEEKKIRFYAILGLPPNASIQEVKQAYKKLVKRCHPDLFFDNPPLRDKAQEILRKINQAYDELCSKNHF
jgi:DnaJ-domain-containing protein 1